MEKIKKNILLLITTLLIGFSSIAQNDYLEAKAEVNENIYNGSVAYEVRSFSQDFKKKNPKNVILLIGDGMGVSQLLDIPAILNPDYPASCGSYCQQG